MINFKKVGGNFGSISAKTQTCGRAISTIKKH